MLEMEETLEMEENQVLCFTGANFAICRGSIFLKIQFYKVHVQIINARPQH